MGSHLTSQTCRGLPHHERCVLQPAPCTALECAWPLLRANTSISSALIMFGQVIAHMMPDLPNVGWERDLESFAEFFENPAFRSDGLKVR